MNCEFCDGVQFEGRLIFENDFVRAFLTNMPIVPGHALVIPKRHFENVTDFTDEEFRGALEAIGKLQQAMVRVFDAHGFNSAFNQGEKAGQSIPHFHLHVIPRTAGDAGIVEYEPRRFLYRPGSRATSPTEELREVAALLKESL